MGANYPDGFVGLPADTAPALPETITLPGTELELAVDFDLDADGATITGGRIGRLELTAEQVLAALDDERSATYLRDFAWEMACHEASGAL